MAASMGKLSEQVIWELRSSPAECCLPILASCLDWEHVVKNECDYMLESIVLDILKDHVCFCLNGHFSLKSTKLIIEYINCTLLTLPGGDTPDIILTFHKLLETLKDFVTEQQLFCYVEFFTETILKHLQLIQFVFGYTRNHMRINNEVCLQTPKVHQKLKCGSTAQTWLYNQTIKRISEEEQSKANNRENLRNAFLGEKYVLLEQMRKENYDIETMKSQEVEKLIQKVTKIHVDTMSSTFMVDLDDFKDKVKYQVLRAKVSKPREDAIQTPEPKDPKSPKRAGSRSKPASK